MSTTQNTQQHTHSCEISNFILCNEHANEMHSDSNNSNIYKGQLVHHWLQNSPDQWPSKSTFWFFTRFTTNDPQYFHCTTDQAILSCPHLCNASQNHEQQARKPKCSTEPPTSWSFVASFFSMFITSICDRNAKFFVFSITCWYGDTACVPITTRPCVTQNTVIKYEKRRKS